MWISIDTKSSLSLTRQLYNQLKERIITGAFAPKEKLPSTRALAEELNISRSTVLEVYDQLIAEGYLEGHHGSGTLVADCIPKHPDSLSSTLCSPSLPDCSQVTEHYIDFRSGVPDLGFFPRKEWGKLYHNVCNDLPNSALRYYNPAGVPELRNTLSQYLYRTRGISCNPNNIMIVSGSTQGLSLISKLLYQDGRKVIAEDPLHPGLLKVIAANNYKINSIPADDQGLCTDLLQPSKDTSFLYTTPSHQYPLGGILPLQRRIALIQYACDNNCYIIEDDYDSEFRFEGKPINSLYELNPQKVIYLGSFSKILAPAIRLGFLLLPDELIGPYKTLKQYTDVHTEAISQYVLAQFIKNGGLERHIWKMKKLYNKKREYLLQTLEAHFAGEYEVKGQAAGLHVVVHFKNIDFTNQLIGQLKTAHVKVYPVAEYSLDHKADHLQEIILGYAHLSLSEIEEGIKILSSSISHKDSL
jgi:GntR family transcriptional regulator/MocR family aminotransferase